MLDAVASGRLSAEVVVVISNNRDAGALRRAGSAGVPALLLNGATHPSAEALDADPYVTETIRQDHASAQAAGHVRCEICEKDPSFKPAGLREDVARRRNGLGR